MYIALASLFYSIAHCVIRQHQNQTTASQINIHNALCGSTTQLQNEQTCQNCLKSEGGPRKVTCIIGTFCESWFRCIELALGE